jgi:hypothetical protein
MVLLANIRKEVVKMIRFNYLGKANENFIKVLARPINKF